MNVHKLPTNAPIIVKNDEDFKLVMRPVVAKIFEAIRNRADQGDEHYDNLGDLIVIIDHDPHYNIEPISEIIAELMDELDPYDTKGLVFDETLFDLNRPTWIDEHTSRFIDTDGDVDNMGPYHDDETVDSFRLTIDLDAVDGYFTRIAFMRSLADELFSTQPVTDIRIRNPVWRQVAGSELEDILLADIHTTARMFGRHVKFLSCSVSNVNIVLHPVA